MNDIISTTIPDWKREKIIRGKYEPWKKLLHVIRRYQIVKNKGGFSFIFRYMLVFRYRFWSVICGAEIPLNLNICGGLIMRHPNGIVIHPDAIIGPNCLICQQVTIGAGRVQGFPKIGGHVDIGAGAKILGGITIGANSVVIDDVPDNCTAVGIPARIIRKTNFNEGQ